jgi:hypothetical protein
VEVGRAVDGPELGRRATPSACGDRGIAADVDHTTGRIDSAEAVLGVRGERDAERRELRDARLAAPLGSPRKAATSSSVA